MMTLTPYLSFDGNCKEAMEFYKSCLGGELEINLVGDSPMAKDMPGKEKQVMHSVLKNGNIILMASDLIMGDGVTRGNGLTLTFNGGTKAEIQEVFNKLKEGGKVTNEIKDTFFGSYGDLTDKFGVLWAFQAEPEKKE